MELEDLLAVFKYLSAPFDGSETSKLSDGTKSTDPDTILHDITEYCLKHVNFLESSKVLFNFNQDQLEQTQNYSSFKLTCIILSLLSELKCAIEKAELEQPEEQKSIEVLSIQAQFIVQKSMELVIGFGLIPYLLPGVGVPDKVRKMNPCVSFFLSDVKTASPFEQFLRLSHTLENLLKISSHASLNALLIPKYSSDILAGILQLCKSPIARPKTDIQSLSGALSLEQYEQAMSIRKDIDCLSTIFFSSIPKSTLINSLFLIGATEKPRWIRNSCNEMLRDIILSPNGLIMVAQTMTDSSPNDSWRLMRIISSLMKLSLDKSGKSKCPTLLRTLSEQCIQMIFQQESLNGSIKSDEQTSSESLAFSSSGLNLELVRIGLFCGISLMAIDFSFVKLVFWDRLFYHVLLLDACQTNQEWSGGKSVISSSNSTSTTALKATQCTEIAELLLSLVKPMSISLPLKSLQPVWSLLFQIFVACERYLKKRVQEPNVAGVAEQLHHKLKDALILLFEIYGSGSGEMFELGSANNANSFPNFSAGAVDTEKTEQVDLCAFALILLLNQEGHAPLLNTLELSQSCDEREVYVKRVRQEVISSVSDYNDVYEHLNMSCQCLSSNILKDPKLKSFWPLLIRQLLSWGRKRQGKMKFKSDEMPTCLQGGDVTVSLEDCQRFITLKLLGELGNEDVMLEQFGNSENLEETFSFLELLLNKFGEECSGDDDNDFDSSHLVMYALGIIGAVVEAASAATVKANNRDQSSSELNVMWDSLQVFIPPLKKLGQSNQLSLTRQGIPEMASGLLISIGTRGKDCRKRNELFTSRFQQAMEDATSPMVHVKGHGLLELRRLVDEKDNETLANAFEVMKVFQCNLVNDDSYVYLMSIQGMATLALKFHKDVVTTLIKEYDFVQSESVNDEDNDIGKRQLYKRLDGEERIEMRMKIGEVLVKVVQKLGGLAPSYRVPLTNVFFRLVRDEEPLIRASALSNLGELCHLLKFSLGVVITEVWYCVESILNTEKDIHVRRAALHLLVLLLKGVAKEMSAEEILSDNIIAQHLRDVRRCLTRGEQTEVDLVAKTHCQLALQELELIVKKLLTPANPLEYIKTLRL